MSANDANVEFSTGATSPEVPQRTPYPIVFVSDLGADEQLRRLTAVDKDELAGVLARAKPKLALAISDPLGSGPDWEFQLAFDSLKSFEPATLLTQLDEARWRLGVREKLVARRQGQIRPDDLDQAISAAAGADASLAWLTQKDVAPPSGAAPLPERRPSA